MKDTIYSREQYLRKNKSQHLTRNIPNVNSNIQYEECQLRSLTKVSS